MTIQPLLEDFIKYSMYVRGYSPNTIKRYRSLTQTFMKRTEVTDTNDLTKQVVEDFLVNGRVAHGWMPNTYRNYHKTLVVFFRWLVEEGHLSENPADGITCPKIITKKIPKHLRRNEAAHLLEVTRTLDYGYRFLPFRNHAIVATFLFTGLRKCELLGLNMEDVNFGEMTMFVRGKNGKERYVPIPSSLVPVLKDYLVERKRLKRTCPAFFTSLARNGRFTETGWKRLARKLKEASELTFGAHTLRHSFAVLMLQGGCDLFTLKQILGHEKIETTCIYLFACHAHMQKAVTMHPLNRSSHQRNIKDALDGTSSEQPHRRQLR